MRRFQKKQLLGHIGLLREACGVVKEQQPGSQKINLCADMQDYVLAILNFLESIAENDVELTELFSELFRMLLGASQEEISSEELLIQIDKIADYAQTRVSGDKLEVAFLCYKASMSDCLESIYLAAKEDKACDAYFIPIPYYDRNPDGTLGQMHCEGEGFYSDKFELVDWKTYDVEKRHPDAVFIMNPYDKYNYVTTVHPDFYASRLKGLTDLLVYVPYYIHNEVFGSYVGNLPGVLFADKVIVQSENIGKQYINSMIEQGVSPEQAEAKIVALGSPKMDKVLDSKKEEYVLPEDWQAVLGKDGEKKLVLLYNLSLESALHYSQDENEGKYLNKLRSVLEFFKHRNDAVLWLRPHPLLEQTFKAMLPDVYSQYQDIMKEYKELGIGIYDDSADMSRAVAYADASFGDASSMNLLFQFAGKPVLIQNVENAGKEPAEAGSREQVKKEMDSFVARRNYNSFILSEAPDASNGGFSLADFIDHFDVIMEYSEAQSADYRRRYMNADGTAGQKIHEYVRQYEPAGKEI